MPSVDTHRPIFIVGCARSGTTLLRSMLTSHPNIAIPPETHFIPRLVGHFGHGPWSQQYVKTKVLPFLASTKHFWDLQIPLRLFRDRITSYEEITAAEFFHVMFSVYANIFGNKSRWGDKTPPYIHHIPLLLRLYPQAQFIHIIRDGRDVTLSMQNARWGGGSIPAAALIWREYVQAGLVAKTYLPKDQYYETKYETLVDNPVSTLTHICTFLGEEYIDEMLTYHQHNIPDTKPVPLGPMTTTRSQEWKKKMSVEQCAIVDLLAGTLLEAVGYERSQHILPLHKKLRLKLFSMVTLAVMIIFRHMPLTVRVKMIRLIALLSSFRYNLRHEPLWFSSWRWRKSTNAAKTEPV